MNDNNKRGFSLLEVVFAFAILQLGLLAIIGVFPGISDMNKNAWKVSIATQLAQEKMEEITANSYFITATERNPLTDNPASLSGCVRKWWAEPDPYGSSNIRVIKVKVEWNERNRVRSVILTSLFYL